MKYIIAFTTFIAFAPLLQAGTPLPLKTQTPDSTSEARKLYDAIAGTAWVYHWRDADFDFTFDTSGETKILKSWSGVKWRVISPLEVILEGTAGNAMLLRFSPDMKSFKAMDWDNQPADGRILKSYGDVKTQITFSNKSKQKIKLYWLNDQGKPEPVKTLDDGESYSANTCTTHFWLITDLDDNAWEIDMGSKQPRTVDVTAPVKP